MMRSWQRVWAVAVKEVRQLRRDRLSLGMIIGVPLMQILLFGYAINFDVRGIKAAVYDSARNSASREIVAQMSVTQVVRVVEFCDSEAALRAALRSGRVAVGIVIPEDIDRRLQAASRPALQIVIDGSQPALQGVVAGLAKVPLEVRRGADANRDAARRVELRTLYNPENRTAVQIVPALIGVILSFTMVLFTAGAVVRERERGNLELLLATPLGRSELMVGKLLPYAVIGLLQTTLILAAAYWLFRVPISGALTTLYAATLLFIAATLAMGLVVSTLAQTQSQAFQLAFTTTLPSILLSGFMFPFDGMPRVAQWLAQVLPLTHFNVIIRGIVLRGAGLLELWQPVLMLLVFLLLAMTVAVQRFRTTLD
jgi:ABC-2 type transport system permease protein